MFNRVMRTMELVFHSLILRGILLGFLHVSQAQGAQASPPSILSISQTHQPAIENALAQEFELHTARLYRRDIEKDDRYYVTAPQGNLVGSENFWDGLYRKGVRAIVVYTDSYDSEEKRGAVEGFLNQISSYANPSNSVPKIIFMRRQELVEVDLLNPMSRDSGLMVGQDGAEKLTSDVEQLTKVPFRGFRYSILHWDKFVLNPPFGGHVQRALGTHRTDNPERPECWTCVRDLVDAISKLASSNGSGPRIRDSQLFVGSEPLLPSDSAALDSFNLGGYFDTAIISSNRRLVSAPGAAKVDVLGEGLGPDRDGSGSIVERTRQNLLLARKILQTQDHYGLKVSFLPRDQDNRPIYSGQGKYIRVIETPTRRPTELWQKVTPLGEFHSPGLKPSNWYAGLAELVGFGDEATNHSSRFGPSPKNGHRFLASHQGALAILPQSLGLGPMEMFKFLLSADGRRLKIDVAAVLTNSHQKAMEPNEHLPKGSRQVSEVSIYMEQPLGNQGWGIGDQENEVPMIPKEIISPFGPLDPPMNLGDVSGFMEVRTWNLLTRRIRIGSGSTDPHFHHYGNSGQWGLLGAYPYRYRAFQYVKDVIVMYPRTIETGKPFMLKVYWKVDANKVLDFSVFYDADGEFHHYAITELSLPAKNEQD